MTIEVRTAEPLTAEPIAEPRTKTVADVLRHAALIIEERGWCQFTRQNAAGEVCAIGAISTAVNGAAWSELHGWYNGIGLPADALVRYVNRGVAGWNDAPGRTAAEVVGALRDAADAAEGGAS